MKFSANSIREQLLIAASHELLTSEEKQFFSKKTFGYAYWHMITTTNKINQIISDRTKTFDAFMQGLNSQLKVEENYTPSLKVAV